MPAGLNQFVGDTGWRLSQGERVRIFLARALLQRAEVLLRDESLAALDPENLRGRLECVLRRAPRLILIAHP
jgi:ATP-binding cassette subfamily B protein